MQKKGRVGTEAFVPVNCNSTYTRRRDECVSHQAILLCTLLHVSFVLRHHIPVTAIHKRVRLKYCRYDSMKRTAVFQFVPTPR